MIGDVDSVTVGVKNVDFEVADLLGFTDKAGTSDAFPAFEVYPLWDSESWLIGVVVIGEDMGISSDYAYVHTSSINQETYTDSDGNHHWFRDVLIDGKITELEYVDDSVDVLNTLQQGEWARIYYNADGTVRRVQLAGNNPGELGVESNIATVIANNNDLELYTSTLINGVNDELYYENGSLYIVSNANTTGFSVRPDVKVAYINADGRGTPYDEVVDGLEGIDNLKRALTRLNKNFEGYVNVIFENNVATVIVLNCTEDAPGYNPGEDTSHGFDVTSAIMHNTANAITVDLTGTGLIPANYPVELTLMKSNNSEGDAIIDSQSYTNTTAYAPNVWMNMSVGSISESGNYYVVVTVKDTNGNVVDTAESAVMHFTFTPGP